MQHIIARCFFLLCFVSFSGAAFSDVNSNSSSKTNSDTAHDTAKAMQAKAIFLYNFANFVEWPDEAFKSDGAPLKMCLYGDVPFGTFLDAISGTLIGRRELKVLRTADTQEIEDGCQILFVGSDKQATLPDFWKNINYFYVLSIGEQDQFADLGGVVNILQTTHRVQFQINISNAINQGLFLSSDLLSLAREIKRNTAILDDK